MKPETKEKMYATTKGVLLEAGKEAAATMLRVFAEMLTEKGGKKHG